MAGEAEAEIPETGAVFTFGKSKFADNVPSKFWLKNGVPLKLACGDEHTALITENGKLFMFGSNNWGQLGLGEKISVNKPTCVKALKSEKVKLVACGRTHTLVYTSCGNLYTAGGNNEGQLGLGDFGERTSFQLVEFFTKHGPVKMIAAGSNTSAAITQDGKLYVWGDNSEGQIGLGEEEGTSTPRELDIGRRVTWISCGYYHSAFVTEDGALFSFGESDSGKLGLCISQFPNHRVPQQVEGICEPVLQVACGGGHTLVLTEKNLYTFGLGQFGQLGHGTFTFETLIPKEVEHFRKGKVKHIACGENHSAVLTESGLLYTFGDGRHGKLALGDEYFANQFKPTLCPRFLKYNVQAVTCGGCHMVVLAKPRLGSEVILEDNDVTEDHLEKLLREAESRHSLNRSLSARDRRRERERSPEQFGIMFQTLPRLNSGELDVSLPAPSQTLPSHLNNRTTNGFQKNSLPSSTGKLTEDHEVDGKTPVEIYRDNQSVKDLGETADLFNLTHAMTMDPAEKTITLSPVQKRKKVKAGGKRSQAVEQLTQDPGADRRWVGLSLSKALPTELLKSHRGKSQFGERQLPSNLHQSSESTGEDGDKANAVKENRIVRHTVRGHRAKTESQPKSKPDLQSKLIEIKPKGKVNSGQEDVHKYEVKAHLSNATGVETETEKEAYKLEEKAKDIRQKGLYLTARSKTRSVDKRQRQAAEEKFLARITQVKRIPPESDGKVENLESNPIAVQSKSLDIEKDVKTWERNSSGEQYNRTSVAPRKTQSSKPERNMKKTKWLEAADRISSPSENTLPSSLVGVTSLTEDFPIKSPVRVLKEVASSQFLSPAASINSSQTGGSRNSLDKQTLLNTASIYEDPDKNVSKRTAVTINVKPVPAASDEETERIMSRYQTEEKTEGKEVESGKKEIGQMDGARKITDSGKLSKDRERVSSVESGMEESKSVAQVANDEGERQDETTWKKVSQDEESKTEPEKGEESDTETEEEQEDEEVSETVEQEEEECRINYDEEEKAKDSEEPEEEDSEEETESIHGEGDDGEEEDTAEEGKDSSEEGKGSVGTEQNKSEDEEESGNESEAESMSGKEEQESEEDEKESEAGQEESREEEDGSVVEQEESEEEEGEESEAGKEEEEESEAGKEEEEESEAGKEEGEEDGEESEEEGEEEGEESKAGWEESEEEEESEAGQEESEAEEEESETEKEESEGEEEENETEKEESEEEEEDTGTEKEESEEEEEESGAEKEESMGEEEDGGTEKEESMGEEEDGGTEKEESEGEAEESETGQKESEDEEEEKETETDSEEKDSGGEEEEGKDTDAENNVAKTERENDSEGEKEEEEGGEQAREDEDEKEEADQEGRGKKKIQKDMTCKEDEERKKKRKGYEMPPKQKSLKSKKSPARRHQSNFESHEPRQFWDDVLPQYLNLK